MSRVTSGFFFFNNILHIQPLMLKCGSKMIFHTEEEEEEAVFPCSLPIEFDQITNQPPFVFPSVRRLLQGHYDSACVCE